MTEVKDEQYGKARSFDPSFKGPLDNRSCTDIICLLLFIIYMIGMVIVAIVAFMNGNPEVLIYPTDTHGLRCGFDEVVIDKPFLYFFDLTQCMPTSLSCDTPQVCVAECPTEYFFPQVYYPIDAGRQELPEGVNITIVDETSRPFICIDGVNQPKTGLDEKQAVDNLECAPYYLESKSFYKRCLPAFLLDAANPNTANEIALILTTVIPDNPVTAEIFQQAIGFIANATSTAEVLLEDVTQSWYIILIGVILAGLLAFVWCLIMRYIAGIMVWCSIVILHVLLGIATFLAFEEYNKVKGTEEASADFMFTLDFDYYLRLEKTWLAIGIICAVFLAITLLLTLCLCNRIRIAIALIKEASRAVGAFWSTLFWPLIPFLLQVGIISLWAVVAVYLGTTRDNTYIFSINGTTLVNNVADELAQACDTYSNSIGGDVLCQVANFTFPVQYKYLQAYNLFGFLWLLNFVIGLSHVVLAGVFATYFWTFEKKNVPHVAMPQSIWRAIRYHLGSVAFGSCIIAIIQFIRVMLEYIELQLNKAKDNTVVKYVLRCLKCLFWCLEKFMKFINKNAYIEIAIYGKNFCSSAKSAFFLLMRNILRVAVVNKITDFLLFIGTIMVTAAITLITIFYFVFSTDYIVSSFIVDNVVPIPNVRYYWVIVIIIAVATFVIAKIFFGVFDMAVDTLFLCFLEDQERHDGSAERPYYMNQELMNIIGKKNDKSAEW